jgi:hypothetical protein
MPLDSQPPWRASSAKVVASRHGKRRERHPSALIACRRMPRRAIFLADFTQMSCASIKNCNVQVPCP